jgi:DNA-binding CsgD family transcriptional regulator
VQFGLTVDDRMLLHLIAAGFSDAEIAIILGRGEPEIARDVALVRRKLQAESRTEAAITALSAHLIA